MFGQKCFYMTSTCHLLITNCAITVQKLSIRCCMGTDYPLKDEKKRKKKKRLKNVICIYRSMQKSWYCIGTVQVLFFLIRNSYRNVTNSEGTKYRTLNAHHKLLHQCTLWFFTDCYQFFTWSCRRPDKNHLQAQVCERNWKSRPWSVNCGCFVGFFLIQSINLTGKHSRAGSFDFTITLLHVSIHFVYKQKNNKNTFNTVIS